MKFNLIKRWSGFLLLAGGLVVLPVHSVFADVWDDLQSDEYKDNEGVEDYVWKEDGSNIPDYPENKDLLEIAGSPAYKNYQYLIDGKTLSIGADGVVRYSIVIRSPSGADNVMYDGLRCISGEIKNYAYGSTDMDGKKVFIPRQTAAWKPVSTVGVTGYSDSLRVNYFCDYQGFMLKRQEIIQNIKYGKGSVDGWYD